MRKIYPVFLLNLLLTSCTLNSQPLESPPWRLVRSGKGFSISGMTLVNQETDRSDFLIVHDNDNSDQNRLAIVTVSSNVAPEYLPLTWPKDTDLPIDLEALTQVTGTTPPSFIAATSKGKMYHLTVDGNQKISILNAFDFPEFPKNSNFEGLDLQEIDGQLLMVWTHRGKDKDPGVIYWGTLELNNYQISAQGSVEFTVPWPTDNVRHISDIKIDPAGILYITSAMDSGDDGPFSSALYIAGFFTLNGSQFQFRSNSQLAALYRFDDHKIEAIELIPGANGGVVFGTDDENMGSSIYTSF